MAYLVAARGGKQDIVLKLYKDRSNTVLTDDDDWVNGTISATEWPTVRILLGAVDHTAAWAKDLTAETIPAGSLKGIPPSAGVYRDDMGEYALRIEPAVTETLGEYTIELAYDVNGLRITKSHSITLIDAGSVIFGSAIVTVDDVKRGLPTTLDSSAIEGLIEEATEYVEGLLMVGGIKDPDAFFTALGGVPKLVRQAVILKARCLITVYDAGAGRRIKSIQEGSERVTFSEASGFYNVCEQADKLIERWLGQNAPGRQPMFGVVTKAVGHTANPRSDWIWVVEVV
jgi:hypothetical protein